MPTTISGTTLTFNDGSTMTSRATIIGAVQNTAFSAFTLNTSDKVLAFASVGSPSEALVSQPNINFPTRVNTGGTATEDGWNASSLVKQTLPSTATSVICGFQFYVSASANAIATGDTRHDAKAQIFQRVVYRSLS
jgi:hypothetical protein